MSNSFLGILYCHIASNNSNMLWFVATLTYHEYAVRHFLSENFIFNQKFWATSDLIKTWWGKSVLVTNLWSKLFKYTISRMFVGFQILQQPGHIILCFRSICIQTVAFWLYFTFIQQFGASYPILPSLNMWNTKNWAESNCMLFILVCDQFWLIEEKTEYKYVRVFRQKRNFTHWSLREKEEKTSRIFFSFLKFTGQVEAS